MVFLAGLILKKISGQQKSMQINPVKVKLSKCFAFGLSLVNKMYNLPRLRRRKSSRFIAERNKVKIAIKQLPWGLSFGPLQCMFYIEDLT